MVDWTFYTPTVQMVSAGELLKAIPSDRIWRLERAVSDQGEELLEMVRAAEQLLTLDVRVRLQNDPMAAVGLRVRDPVYQDRHALDQIGAFPSRNLALVAELKLSDNAIQAGHLDICDDVLTGLEALFPGGVVVSQDGETMPARAIADVLNNAKVTHIDLAYGGAPDRMHFIGSQLAGLPGGFGPRILVGPDMISLRTRMPGDVSPQEQRAICNAATELAKYAQKGRVRFRERGMWRDAVTDIGTQVAPLPNSESGGVLGRISRFLRSK